tara:strand:+ start:24956 stop:25270 length:315 start_codon:yes stop_codon:yes gene_type:complete
MAYHAAYFLLFVFLLVDILFLIRYLNTLESAYFKASLKRMPKAKPTHLLLALSILVSGYYLAKDTKFYLSAESAAQYFVEYLVFFLLMYLIFIVYKALLEKDKI